MKNKIIDTKKFWDVEDEKMKGRVEPIEITMLLQSEEYGEQLGKICILDYYIVGLGFEKRMTAYGKKRALKCSGGFNGCNGPGMVMNSFGESLCQFCLDKTNEGWENGK